MKPLLQTAAMLLILLASSNVQAHEGHAHGAEQGQAFIDPNLLGFSGLRQIVNVHPAFVHFPLGLFPAALLLYSLGMMWKRPSWLVAGRACLYLAAAGSAVTILTGWQAQGTFPHNERVHHMMMTHLHIGLVLGGLAAILTGWSFVHRAQRPRGAPGFLMPLILATYLALQNGDLGSRMVYVEGAAVNVAIPSHGAEETVPHQHSHGH